MNLNNNCYLWQNPKVNLHRVLYEVLCRDIKNNRGDPAKLLECASDKLVNTQKF